MLTKTSTIEWQIIAGTGLMLVMLASIIIFVFIYQRRTLKLQIQLQIQKEEQQSQLIKAAIQSEETERGRIAAELHDEVGALLSTVKLYIQQIQPHHLKDPTKIDTLSNCKELLDQTVVTVRNISANMQPSTIMHFGLESAIANFCAKLNQPPALETALTVQGPLEKLTAENELAVYRIVQELTNNILKHANASRIQFNFIQKSGQSEIIIEHNGTGLSQQEFEEKLFSINGLGLKNIQNRLNILKGNIFFKKTTNAADSITVSIPTNH